MHLDDLTSSLGLHNPRRTLFGFFGMVCATMIANALVAAETSTVLYEEKFAATPYGRIPAGWSDLNHVRPNRNWAVDGNGLLRHLIKNRTGLVTYEGYTHEPKPARSLTNVKISATFHKTVDDEVTFGVVGRVQDGDNFYCARFCGANRLELVVVQGGVETALDTVPLPELKERRPTGRTTIRRYAYGERWTLALELRGERIAAAVFDAAGREQARLSAVSGAFSRGTAGLRCTRFAAAESFRLEAFEPFEAKADDDRLAKRNAIVSADEPEYEVVRPDWEATLTVASLEQLAPSYDVIVAGAGTGGWAAAVEAARAGCRVLLIEETDWIGGQMAAAGVTTMDEDSGYMKFPVRERGLYREFHESMVLYYQTLDKDPQVAYYGWPDQLEGGYEPRVARAVMQALFNQARMKIVPKPSMLSLRTRIVGVKKTGDVVTGVTLSTPDGGTRDIACCVLIDATEYGDVIPLTGARYRVGNCLSDKVDPDSLVQDHTWTCIVREYPEGVPEELQIKQPPPGYETSSGKRYRKYTNDGVVVWGGAGKGYKGPRHWSVFFAWRGMADSASPLVGLDSSLRHTRCGFNGGNDYSVTAATIEDPARRKHDEREGIYKTLGALYYFQQELGVNWSLSADEGFNTPSNRQKMKSLDLRPDLLELAVHLPQHPYVRECRRIVGVDTLKASDLGRYEQARHVTTSVAMGDYFMDLDHGRTAHAIETDLDSGPLPTGGGPFQVPFEVFIPEKVDGFLVAEKNLSQSRLANGATRLQPITMLTGQAAGVIAALAVGKGVQPRAVRPIDAQMQLLNGGSTLIQRWYADVSWRSDIWRATQLLSLHQIMDRPGELVRDPAVPLGAQARWGVDEPLAESERAEVVARLKAHLGREPKLPSEPMTAGRFAVAAARELIRTP